MISLEYNSVVKVCLCTKSYNLVLIGTIYMNDNTVGGLALGDKSVYPTGNSTTVFNCPPKGYRDQLRIKFGEYLATG